MKTILYVIKSMAMLAGTERAVSLKINWLASHGYKVVLVTYEQGSHPIILPLHPDVIVEDLKTPFFVIRKYSLFRRGFEFLRLKSIFRSRLRSVLEEIRPDIILTTAYSLEVVKELFEVHANSKLIIESHETCSSVIKEYAYKSHSFMLLLAKLYDKYNLKYVNHFDRLITLTQGDAVEWYKHIFVPIEVIPNPLTDYPFSLTDKSENTSFRIISAGRLEEVKGFDRLVKAFAIIEDKCPKWHVDIFGKGNCEGELRKLIASYHLDNRIKILPPTNNIYSEYLNSDFYVLSSHHEGLGMVLLEAMACGIPCVSFDCDYGPKEVIDDGNTGLLVENGNIEKLSQSILWMIEHRNERIRMGENARKAVKRYQIDDIMQQWVDLFNRI